jgi:hypothetical protein
MMQTVAVMSSPILTSVRVVCRLEWQNIILLHVLKQSDAFVEQFPTRNKNKYILSPFKPVKKAAVEPGHLAIVQWLHEYRPNRLWQLKEDIWKLSNGLVGTEKTVVPDEPAIARASENEHFELCPLAYDSSKDDTSTPYICSCGHFGNRHFFLKGF